MAMDAAVVTKRTDLSQLDYTLDLITSLSDEELRAIQAVAEAFVSKGRTVVTSAEMNVIEPFQPQTEDQLLARIDHSLAQIENGQYSNAENVENELLARFDI